MTEIGLKEIEQCFEEEHYYNKDKVMDIQENMNKMSKKKKEVEEERVRTEESEGGGAAARSQRPRHEQAAGARHQEMAGRQPDFQGRGDEGFRQEADGRHRGHRQGHLADAGALGWT
eukprot:2984902-Heterocapsa_arctica.AAC.1